MNKSNCTDCVTEKEVDEMDSVVKIVGKNNNISIVNKFIFMDWIRNFICVNPNLVASEKGMKLNLFMVRDLDFSLLPVSESWINDKLSKLSHNLLSNKYKDKFESLFDKSIKVCEASFNNIIDNVYHIIERNDDIDLENDLYEFFGITECKIIS